MVNLLPFHLLLLSLVFAAKAPVDARFFLSLFDLPLASPCGNVLCDRFVKIVTL